VTKKKTIVKTLLVIFFLSTSLAQASNFYDVKYVDNYDGDTITVNIPYVRPLIGDRIKVRVRGIDTAEIKGACEQEIQSALSIRDRVKSLLINAEQIDLMNVERGSFFRIIADVTITREPRLIDDGVRIAGVIDLGQFLLSTSDTVPYVKGDKTNVWCD
jgi:micrococcal nuclease